MTGAAPSLQQSVAHCSSSCSVVQLASWSVGRGPSNLTRGNPVSGRASECCAFCLLPTAPTLPPCLCCARNLPSQISFSHRPAFLSKLTSQHRTSYPSYQPLQTAIFIHTHPTKLLTPISPSCAPNSRTNTPSTSARQKPNAFVRSTPTASL